MHAKLKDLILDAVKEGLAVKTERVPLPGGSGWSTIVELSKKGETRTISTGFPDFFGDETVKMNFDGLRRKLAAQ